MATGTVTLDKAYFETLLRSFTMLECACTRNSTIANLNPANRAQFHSPGTDFTTPLDVPTVTIPKNDHDSLLAIARQFANLKRNLYRGGIAEETLTILLRDDSTATQNGDSTIYSTADGTSDSAALLTQTPLSSIQTNGQDYTFGRNANYTPRNGELRPQNGNGNGFHSHSQTNDDASFMPDCADGFYDGESGNNDSQTKNQRQQYDKFAKRTVLLSNLHETTTHQDIVDAVRGGMLLDVYLRIHDRTANVSFLEESQAHDFFRHVKRHDLYIRGKRVEIRWNERQFILPGHVANKIAIGATRNLVIQNYTPRHTEEAIREDLEHIHNLVVIKVSFGGNNAYISTNSVHNAMFARTCMMSRATYKGSKIEWDYDECAAPLQVPPKYQKENIQPKKKDAPLNRFHLLNMDDDDDDELDSSGLSLPTFLSGTSVAA
ncbi:Negative regulator of differentiation [Lachnellula suecica]|uniref:Negative regulator of differentiation n=1 Tax=Lachnellula suecica TaxID=602035 RepID=A0A8T9BV50_9HELO|nr:Negative regulator of differentiation [Lachnellula suecica]